MSDKDAEIECLKQQLAGLQGDTVMANLHKTVTTEPSVTGFAQSEARPSGMRPQVALRVEHLQSITSVGKTRKSLDDWVPVLQ